MSLDAALHINMLRAEFQSPLASDAISTVAQPQGDAFSGHLAGFDAPSGDKGAGTTFLSDVSGIVSDWSKGANEIKKMFDEALAGKPLSATQLLYLQASTHAVAFEFEAMGKVVETSSNAIKTTVQTQV